ncbi:uncharacterized protein LOC123269872 [Cotesia glomerata]|uniref:uncharacterized protein LOC123269872 n=1 Tax=Cotesia glomerata TaxID=32391 RepID=UPI001D02CEDF|nr:uncharacterized protein LOC123269872 [Cotesia glomerata]
MLRRLLPNSCFSTRNELLEDGCSHQRCPDSNHRGYCCVRETTLYRQNSFSIHQDTKSVSLPTFRKPMHDVEASLLQADLSKPLSKIGRSTNHMLQVRERCLPSEPKHQELR